jgi:hypothetical protein
MDEYGYTDFDKDEDVFDEDEDGLLADGDLLEMLHESDNNIVKNDADGLDQSDFEDDEEEEDFESL